MPGRCGFATSTLRSSCPLPPSPASPHEPRRTSSARLMLNPRRSCALKRASLCFMGRAVHAAPAPRQSRSLAKSGAQAGCRISPDSDEVGTSVVSRRARPLVIFSVPPIFKHHPDTISKSRHRAQHDGAQRQSSNPVAQGHSKQTLFRLSYSQRGNPNQCRSYPTTLHPPTAALQCC
jgi:hypothetical protein